MNPDELIGIEEEFSRSWNRLEHIFRKDYENYKPENIRLMLQFIAELRAENYDKWFRAGQATNTLFIARSRELKYSELGRKHMNYIIFGATRQIPPQLHVFSRINRKVRQFYASGF